jgi:hypothetical protein
LTTPIGPPHFALNQANLNQEKTHWQPIRRAFH